MNRTTIYVKFTQKFDVWTFGVTTWEIFTLAKERPYNDMSDKQVVEDAIKGKNRKLLARPDMCSPEVYEIMLNTTPSIKQHLRNFISSSPICSDQH